MTTIADARGFVVELISQLFHAEVLIAEQAERIEVLEAEVARAEGRPRRDGGRVSAAVCRV